MKCNTRFLYTVWRNRDDRLMILDGTADECAEAMKVAKATFRKFCARGGNADWTIEKRSLQEIERETAE